jgi:hypothetical protein
VAFRPDLKEAFHYGLAVDLGGGAETALEAVFSRDKEGFGAVTTIVVTTYYMTPRVREALGFPGQENVAYDPFATRSDPIEVSLPRSSPAVASTGRPPGLD